MVVVVEFGELVLLMLLLLFDDPPQRTFVTRSITLVLPTMELLLVMELELLLLPCFLSPLIRFVNSADARSTMVF